MALQFNDDESGAPQLTTEDANSDLAAVLPYINLIERDPGQSSNLDVTFCLRPLFAWEPLATPPPLAREDVHVWSIQLDQDARLAEDWEIISKDERNRALRFRSQRDRTHYICSHANMRRLLAGYLDCAPNELAFKTGTNGKPELTGDHAGMLQFNLSHSDQVALLAVTQTEEVGVDVEKIRTIQERDLVAKCFFAPGEFERFHKLPESSQELGFFHCWTRKEAYLKARGFGITNGLESFEVSIEPDCEPKLLSVRDEPSEIDAWKIFHLAPCPGYVGALAVRLRVPRLHLFHFPAL